MERRNNSEKRTGMTLVFAVLFLGALGDWAQDQLSVITKKQAGRRMRHSRGLFDPESNADSYRIETGETVRGDFKYRVDFYSSVAFWYQKTVSTPCKPFPPVNERLMPEV